MDLYLLRPKNSNAGPWDPWYDTCAGFVIRANDSRDARFLAALHSGEEDGSLLTKEEKGAQSVWLDETLVDCTCLASNVSGELGIIIRDFRAA